MTQTESAMGKIDFLSRMMWAGPLVQMEEDRLPKRAEAVKQRGRMKGSRPQCHVRWEDCVKRDVRKVEEAAKWRLKAADREKWKGMTGRSGKG